MKSPVINPAHWRLDTLLSFDSQEVHDLARHAAGTLTSYRLVLGRCLLVLQLNKAYSLNLRFLMRTRSPKPLARPPSLLINDPRGAKQNSSGSTPNYATTRERVTPHPLKRKRSFDAMAGVAVLPGVPTKCGSTSIISNPTLKAARQNVRTCSVSAQAAIAIITTANSKLQLPQRASSLSRIKKVID